MKKLSLFLLAMAICLVAFRSWWQPRLAKEAAELSVPRATSDLRETRLDVGLSEAEAKLWHHHDEGSGFLPLSFFYALEDSQTGKPFIEALSRFGFVPDPSNQHGLPIGLSAAPLSTAPNKALMVGVSCAACHSGQYTYQGAVMTIDGAPNMLDFEALLDSLEGDLAATLGSPSKLFKLIESVMAWEQRLGAEEKLLEMHPSARRLVADAAEADEGHPLKATRAHLEAGLHAAYHAETPAAASARLIDVAGGLQGLAPEASDGGANDDAGAWQHLKDGFAKMGEDLAFLRRHGERLVTLKKSYVGETAGGPGRADSFDAIWDLLVQTEQVTPMTAPVSIPHLFGYADFHWVHWDGNSSAAMGRDYAQAIALGADYFRDTHVSTVLPHNVIELELTAHRLQAPVWPAEFLGAIDAQLVVKGEALYAQHCLSCHSEETLTPLEEIGTDPQRAENFAALSQDGKSYADLLIELGNAAASSSFASHGVTEEDLAPVERSDHPTWRVTGAYHTRRLGGIWASPPYLHNGSVPTLWDLLQPVSARPQKFAVGRELDAKKVGIDVDRQGAGAWVFDVTQKGNANTGHTYGSKLVDADKWALVEYMKTL
ncbi:MAG: hypothetical protein K0U98_11055 [Deltaproteobacteria bacterium]|nr:hypothetical protein [Deltaproteobacteria bacterium]